MVAGARAKFFACAIFATTVAALLTVSIATLDGSAKRTGNEARLAEMRRIIKAGKAPSLLYELQGMVRDNPDDAEAWSILSKVYLETDMSAKDFGKALNAAQKAVDLKPHNSTYLKMLAELYARHGEFQKAIGLIEKAEKCKHVDIFVFKTHALILSDMKRDKEAAQYWDKFVAVYPHAMTNPNQLDGGAMIYARAGQVEKAIGMYDKLYQTTLDQRWIMKKAECYIAIGRKNEAIGVYTKLIAKHPDDEMARLERSRIYTRLGMNKEALADLDVVVREMPTSSIYRERARVYEKLGNANMAKKDRERAESF